ncbi:MAG: polysaccharide deacetylase family protein [Eubacteriales bacterium]
MLRQTYRFCRKIARGTGHWAANQFDPPVIVLIYHRVTDLPSDPQLLAVCPDNFRKQLKHIKENFPVLRFDGDWSKVTRPSVVITFDDGYADNALEALPILEEVDLPATFFVSTGYIDKDEEFWWDELERVVLLPREFSAQFVLRDKQVGKTWPTATDDDRQVLYRDMHALIKKVDTPYRQDWLGQLRDWAGLEPAGRASHRPISLAELRTMALSPLVTIGAHTMTHPSLSVLTVERQHQEIIESKNRLKNWLKKDIEVFSYPFGGRHDYTDETVNIVKEAGFDRAASNYPGQWHRWVNPFQVPRQLVRNWDIVTFEKYLKRFWIL